MTPTVQCELADGEFSSRSATSTQDPEVTLIAPPMTVVATGRGRAIDHDDGPANRKSSSRQGSGRSRTYDSVLRRIRIRTLFTHLNDALLCPTRPAQDGILLVHRQGRAPRSRASSSAPGLRPRQEIPGQIPHPRRPAGRLGRLLVLPLERRALRRQRLRRGHDQPARLNRLRPGHRRRRQRRLGRQALHRPDDRPRLRRAALPLHRQDPRVRPRRKLRRIHGQLGPRPHQPLQVHRQPRRHVQRRVRLRHPRKKTGSTSGSSKAIPGTTTASPTARTPSASGRPRSPPKTSKRPLSSSTASSTTASTSAKASSSSTRCSCSRSPARCSTSPTKATGC